MAAQLALMDSNTDSDASGNTECLDDSLTTMQWLPHVQLPAAIPSKPETAAEAVVQPIKQGQSVELSLAAMPGLGKPALSYEQMIAAAINSTPTRSMHLAGIYQWMQDHFPFFRTCPGYWKVRYGWLISVHVLVC